MKKVTLAKSEHGPVVVPSKAVYGLPSVLGSALSVYDRYRAVLAKALWRQLAL